MGGIEKLDLIAYLATAVEQALNAKLEDFRSMPFIGGLITPERVAGISAAVLKQLVFAQPAMIAQAKRMLDEGLDLEALLRVRMESIDLVELERQLWLVIGAELRHLRWMAATCGVLLGGIQVGALIGIQTIIESAQPLSEVPR